MVHARASPGHARWRPNSHAADHRMASASLSQPTKPAGDENLAAAAAPSWKLALPQSPATWGCMGGIGRVASERQADRQQLIGGEDYSSRQAHHCAAHAAMAAQHCAHAWSVAAEMMAWQPGRWLLQTHDGGSVMLWVAGAYRCHKLRLHNVLPDAVVVGEVPAAGRVSTALPLEMGKREGG